MIKCDKGNVVIQGSASLVFAELSTLVHSLHYDVLTGHSEMAPEESREKILKAVEDGFMSDEELKKQTQENVGEVFGKLMEALKDILQGKGVE